MQPSKPYLVDGRFTFGDLVDIDRLRNLFERFSRATGYTTELVSTPDREPLVATGWRDIRTKFRCACPTPEVHHRESDMGPSSCLETHATLNLYRCEGGLVDGWTPIVIGGAHVADLASGQVFFEEPDSDLFRSRGEERGYNVNAYLDAVEEVPVVPQDAFEEALAFLSELAVTFAERGLSEIRSRESVRASKEAEANLRSTLNSIGDAVVATASLDGKVTYANPAFLKAWGFENPDEVIGRPFPEFWMVDEKLNEIMAALLGEEREWRGEIQARKRDGQLFDVQVSAATVLDDDGLPIALTSTSINITDRKRVEEALRTTETRLNESQRIARIGSWDLDLVTNALHWSDEVYRMFDSPPRKLGATYEEFLRHVHPDDRGLVDDAYSESVKNGTPYDITHRLLLKDGTTKFVHERCETLYDDAGRGVRSIGTVQDVTDRKRAEEELDRLRNYLANIIDSMPSVLVGVDTEGKVTQWNSEARRATGLNPEAALSQPLARAFPRLSAEMGQVREAMRSRKTVCAQKQAYQKGGETRYEDVTVYPLVTNGVEGAVIRVDDVTDRVRIEETMVQNEKMMSIGGLAAGMAHEINNPLAGMMQTANVLLRRLTEDLPANDRAAVEAGATMNQIRAFMEARGVPKMLRDIQRSGRRAGEIVANMLGFVRKSNSGFSTHDLTELLDRCVDLAGSDYDLKRKYDFREIEIVREYERDVPEIPLEKGKIQQVLLNLLRNGAEAMQEAATRSGESERKASRFVLRLAHEPEARMLRVEIEDNGPGMDKETRRRVFEPFFTTKPTDRGTGLGLSVSYFIITETHGGEMSVESQPGKGTTFIIRLPLERRGSRPSQ